VTLSFVFCGIIINQLLSQVFTVEQKTFSSKVIFETIPKLGKFGFIRCKIVLKAEFPNTV
jgi:hypothetical protein